MKISRREFIAAGSALALSPYLHAQGNETLRIGLIGCGGRGTGAADDCLSAAKGIELFAMADVFPDRLASSRKYFEDEKKIRVPEERCFTGFDAYRKLLAIKEIDLVLLATPPGFRPLHFAAAIEAGKHVFMEKPVAVDPVGIRKVLAAGEAASQKKLAVVAGTQRRHFRCYREGIAKIHDGSIGEIVAGRCAWRQGGLWSVDRAQGMNDMEWQLRNWLYFDWLSGDHNVEQHVHNLDVMNWALRAHPVRATGVGGRIQRTQAKFGNIYDHFDVDYEYPGGVHVISSSRQIQGADGYVGETVIGTLGRANPAGDGKGPNPYVEEHKDLIASIRAGKPLNEAQAVAEATMTAILGREAAYTGKALTWDALLKSDLDLSPPKHEFGALAVRDVPVPGRKR